jgi:hypothetical protein
VKLFLAIIAGTLILAANGAAQAPLVPNPKLTPGRIARTDKDRAGITLKLEQKVFARYRLPWERRREFKIDHLIPTELGGADTLDNLWPQSVRAKPYGTDRKELLADVLMKKVRERKLTIEQAQEAISRDWIDAFIDHVGMVYLK